ncbi:MAG: hypothetical protein NDF55_05305 [archaeon GB-1867-005]|nr:hypothetical protein [Candidatus Culexmicrobium cathedralense]
MPKCPYARKPANDTLGFYLFCERLKQNVSTSIFPCYGDYAKCRYYVPPLTVKPEVAVGRGRTNCLKCVFYSEVSKRCLKLNVEVVNPNKPPCEEVGSENS